MGYRLESPGPTGSDPSAPRTPHEPSPTTAQETLSWIRALASQWEDEQGRPHLPPEVPPDDR